MFDVWFEKQSVYPAYYIHLGQFQKGKSCSDTDIIWNASDTAKNAVSGIGEKVYGRVQFYNAKCCIVISIQGY